MNMSYIDSPFYYSRRITKEVKVRDIGIGGQNPIRIQSMTTTDTMDTIATVEQTIQLFAAGCEIVRITAPSKKDAENLRNIREELKRRGYGNIPLVADIHFSPATALIAVEYADKVRINPGNFTDKKKFDIKEYSESEYAEEVERAREAFLPLLRRCKELGVALRIGTNHGSLSDRMMNRFGDSPLGMVESALEFIRFAENESFREIVVSMKSSNPKVMIQAYRLLAARFRELKMDYPLHLGVTEAGDGQDGRIRSAVGIGSLLADGLGDTIRVSLTEDPIEEIPVAKLMVTKFNHPFLVHNTGDGYKDFRNPFEYRRFYSRKLGTEKYFLGDENPVGVEVSFNPGSVSDWLEQIELLVKKTKNTLMKPEIFHCNTLSLGFLQELSAFLNNHKNWHALSIGLNLPEKLILTELDRITLPEKIVIDPFQYSYSEVIPLLSANVVIVELNIKSNDINKIPDLIHFLKEIKAENICFSLHSDHKILHDYRKMVQFLQFDDYPIILTGNFKSREDALYDSAIHLGALLEDGIGDSVRIESLAMLPEELNTLTYDLLQVCGLRSVKTDFISCPSCGRTLFNIQETLARIKQKTSHLQGVKIAVMGCIVNGPGEMADADYGYVGAGPGKVHLYKKKEIIEKSIPSTVAEERLIELIKEDGKWIEP